ncbi:hypothetical protein LTR78_007706 [Recurvomyces mirabilis]|uniref:Uncharacterized protein n=1 Tax=Recurvomyces mirabilis TaxID=574656 RepID=A0AAE0TRE6_9PEZI|nr:hypothetical protein LTR78_007706 [Recurvomyces mirabilis]KAK5151593.1 hypothetical protein LTS14_009080 [Recurvomyces mirabilis]
MRSHPSANINNLWITDTLLHNLDRAREITDSIRADLDHAEHVQELSIRECRLHEDVLDDMKQRLRSTSRISFHYACLEADYQRSIDQYIAAKVSMSDAHADIRELFRNLGGASRTERAAEDEYLDHLDQIERRRDDGARRLAEEAEQLAADAIWRRERQARHRRRASSRRRERDWFISQQAEDEADERRQDEKTRQREEGARRLAEEACRLEEEEEEAQRQEAHHQAEHEAQEQRERRRRQRSESFRGKVPNFASRRPATGPAQATAASTSAATFFAAAEKAFANYAAMTAFPEPPAIPCYKCQAGAQQRALQGCEHNIRSTFSSLSAAKLKLWRAKFHPDRFCAIADLKLREECKRKAQEVFVVLSEMISSAGK